MEQAEPALQTAMELALPTISVEEVLAVIERRGGLAGVLQEAADEALAALYTSMGVSAVYDPKRNEVRLGVDPLLNDVSEGDSYPHPTRLC